MTRINTNVSSLTAQKTLARSNASLQEALTRLSTGLRINAGKDDPAGLIASEALRSDIISVQRAIGNSERANQMIATADSALGEVSSLLNDIRGLVTEAANEGALSDDQIAANQLQIDSSLEAINRIAQMTSFQGRNLLDGSLDFLSTAGTVATIEDIQIDQAAIGSTGQVAVDVDIATAAAKAAITDNGFTTAAAANDTLTFVSGALLESGGGAEVAVMQKNASYAGTLAGVTVVTNAAATAVTVSINGTDIEVEIDTDTEYTAKQIADAINAEATVNDDFEAVCVSATDAAWSSNDVDDETFAAPTLKIEADAAGAAFNNMAISIATGTVAVDAPTVVYDGTLNTLTITVNDSGMTDLDDIKDAIDDYEYNGSEILTATVTAGANRQHIYGAGNDVDETGNTGTSGGALLEDDLVVQITGNKGMEVFSFDSGTGANMVVSAINLVSDATGVEASVTGNTVTLNSTQYGSNSYVEVNVISEGTSGTFTNNLSSTRETGDDIEATVNGIGATGNGNELSINTSTLAMTILVSDGSSTNFDFNITGGGALFQLGPDVVTNQQARLGIQSVNTAALRGESGRLYELGSGKTAALNTSPSTAANIVDEVMADVTSLRGRLGAFQKTTLDTNMRSLNDTLENLTDAESTIRDADFAAESAALTRSQILVQSGISVLSIANSNPQNVLALLR